MHLVEQKNIFKGMFKKRSQSSGSKRRRQVDITDVDMKEKVVISGKMETKKKMNQFSVRSSVYIILT